HTGSWAEAYPDIITCANMFWWPAGTDWPDRLAAEPGTGQLNPLNSNTYKVAKNAIRDVINMFPDAFFHAGADEVTPNCWKSDPDIQAFLAKNGTLSQLLEMFVNSTLPYIISHNRTVIYWEDVLLDANINVAASLLPKEYVILQTWNNGPSNTKKLVEAGYRVIVSSADYYYLDCGHGGWVGNDSLYNQPPGTDLGNGGSWCAPFKTWQTIYNYDITYGLNTDNAKLVLGGEVALWSEQADPTVMDPRIWPRASAMAETLWSGNRDSTGMKRYAEATDRLNEWRNRMVTRGIGKKLVEAGYRVIVSSAEFYYLDCGHRGWAGNDSQYNQPPGTNLGNGGSWCAPFKTWQTIYNYDITYGLHIEEAKLVLGGEVVLWSEQADPAVMDPRIWPRVSAMAETLWSGNRDSAGMKRYAEATDRLNEWRNRMVTRGIGAEPIQPLWCFRNPGICNTIQPFKLS
ncbi:hypothetical protein ACH5RR_000633, partial [Cinchona calisaya]